MYVWDGERPCAGLDGKKRAVKLDTLLTTHCVLSARYWRFGGDRRWGQEAQDSSEGRMDAWAEALGAVGDWAGAVRCRAGDK